MVMFVFSGFYSLGTEVSKLSMQRYKNYIRQIYKEKI